MMKIRQSDTIALIKLLSAVVTAQSTGFRITVPPVRETAESSTASPADYRLFTGLKIYSEMNY